MLLSELNPAARSLFRSKPLPNSRQDRILGALLGAAIGDVMGNAISGLSKETIKDKYGDWGITSPPHNALVSYNFSLTLFALDSLIFSTQKRHKLSVIEICNCLIKCIKEWEVVMSNPKLFHGINHLADKSSVCTDFIKNYPLWKFTRPGSKYIKGNLSELINPLLIAVLLCANGKTTSEVAEELAKKLGEPEFKIDVDALIAYFYHKEDITKEIKLKGLNTMREQINSASRPDLLGMLAGFEHGAKYGIQGFKQVWYLRIDATILIEQLGWRVGRVIKSYL